MNTKTVPQFLVCVNNAGYAGSLELRKLYQAVPDPDAAKHNQVRVVDESGEDYLYSADRFIRIDMTKEQSSAVLKAS